MTKTALCAGYRVEQDGRFTYLGDFRYREGMLKDVEELEWEATWRPELILITGDRG